MLQKISYSLFSVFAITLLSCDKIVMWVYLNYYKRSQTCQIVLINFVCYLPTFQKNLSLMYKKLDIVLFQFTRSKLLFIALINNILKRFSFSHTSHFQISCPVDPNVSKVSLLSNFAHLKLLGVNLPQKNSRLFSYLLPLSEAVLFLNI